ncbi:MAG: 4Fe-4S dicluster domain-containing protein, partial [Pseudomonadota bacterium]
GQINVNTDGCTLCLACVSACPADAISDRPDRPQISFTEAACVQCGLCAATCPEGVIALEPRFNFSTDALSPAVIKTEEPFACISCGKEFGSKSSIEAVTAKLRGHSMFQDSDQLRIIQMCDDCRVEAVANSEQSPFAGPERPRVRTTSDYLEVADGGASAKRSRDDFLN